MNPFSANMAGLSERIDQWAKDINDELDEMIGDHIELIGRVAPNRNEALCDIAAKFGAMHYSAEVGEINELVSLLVIAIDRLARQREALS